MKGNILLNKFIAFTITFVIAIVVHSTPSSAGTITSVIGGGSLKGGTIGFSPISATLNGTQITTSSNWTIDDVTDARGTGSGWNVALTLTQFKEVDDSGTYVTAGKTLSTGSLKVTTVPTISKIDITSSNVNTITPVALYTALDTGSTVKLLSAGVNGGMGSFRFGNLGVTLTIPADAYAKTYKTEATTTLNLVP